MIDSGYCVLNNVDLYAFNSMKIHSKAEMLYLPYTTDGIIEICHTFSSTKDIVILGKGSNTIFSKTDCTKPVVCTNMLNLVQMSDKNFVVQSGVTLNELAWFAQEKGVAGYEFLEDIPGSVGGALFMNAGTNAGTISELVESATIYDFASKSVKEICSDDLKKYWGKRKSYFQQFDCCVLECRMKADVFGDREDILNQMLEIKKSRYIKQPREYPSAGSVFKRPSVNGKDVFVWKLLEDAGLRGYSVGGAQVSEKHPGFIVNRGGGTGSDFVELLNICKSRVKDLFMIDLEEEWIIV